MDGFSPHDDLGANALQGSDASEDVRSVEINGSGDGQSRDAARDSMFLQATLRPASGANPAPFSVRVRNLSAGGLMADADVVVAIGDPITIEIRNVGQVAGRVAWIREARFGVTFDTPIDPKLARKPIRPSVPQPVISSSGYHRTTHPLG